MRIVAIVNEESNKKLSKVFELTRPSFDSPAQHFFFHIRGNVGTAKTAKIQEVFNKVLLKTRLQGAHFGLKL